jgi:hypothetical protein
VAGAKILQLFAYSNGQMTAKKGISSSSGRGWGCGKTLKNIHIKKTVRGFGFATPPHLLAGTSQSQLIRQPHQKKPLDNEKELTYSI